MVTLLLNERVYEELTKARSELKTIQMRTFEENQQLAQQLANAKCACACVCVCVHACVRACGVCLCV